MATANSTAAPRSTRNTTEVDDARQASIGVAGAILDLIATLDAHEAIDGLRKGTVCTACLHALDLLDEASDGKGGAQ